MNRLVTKPTNQPDTADDAIKSVGAYTHPLLHVLILIALTMFAYGRSITAYFLADDFGHISVVRSIMQGRTELFWANFAGNFNQIPGMNMYRPLQLTTEILDYALFKGNAAGWYASNLLYYTGAMIALYFLCREVFRAWGVGRSSLIALMASGLVAASPLHCESTSWMVGRVDPIACLFGLMSFCIFIRSQTWRGRAVAIAAFIYAILNKEMPVMLPIVITAYYLFGLDKADAQIEQKRIFNMRSLFDRIKQAFVTTAPYWATLVVYFVVRFKCLGTVGGGYVGGFQSTLPQMIGRWTDADTLHRLFFSFNTAVVPEPNIYSKILAVCYAVVGVLAVARLLLGTMPWRYLAFVSVWIATCAIPIYSVWGLGYNLEGGRFYFFLSVPIGVMIAMLALAPFAGRQESASDVPISRLANFDWRATALGVGALAVAVLDMARVSAMTNAAWVHAGREIRKFADACVQLTVQDPSKTYVILGIPEDHAGAHQLLNGRTFNKLFMPPFMADDQPKHLVNFLPTVYGPANLINATRFRQCIAEHYPVCLWSSETNTLSSIKINAGDRSAPPIVPALNSATNGFSVPSLAPQTIDHQVVSTDRSSILLRDVKADDGIRIDNLNLPTIDYDFLEFDARFAGGARERTIKVSWTPAQQGSSVVDGAVGCATKVLAADNSAPSSDHAGIAAARWVHVRVRLSNYWRWFAEPKISSLFLQPGVATTAELRNIRVVADRTITPQLSLVGPQENASGYRELPQPPLTVRVDARGVEGAATACVEITKPNFFFDSFEQSDDSSAVGATIPVGLNGDVTIKDAMFKKAFSGDGFYQIRVRCFDARRKPVGEPSDPLSVHYSKSAW
jgi:hypothetical protein